MSQTIALIPARGGSKGVLGKNLKMIGGHPLIAYSIAAAKRASCIDRVVVSTDSEDIASVSRKYGAEVPFMRPAQLAGDRSTDFDVINHFLVWQKENEQTKVFDFLFHIRPTTPLRLPKSFDEALKAIMAAEGATSLRSVHEMSETSYKTCEIVNGWVKGLCCMGFEADELNKPRQLFPSTYVMNGYVDIIKRTTVENLKLLHGNQCLPFKTKVAPEIDTEEDFEYIEFLINKQKFRLEEIF